MTAQDADFLCRYPTPTPWQAPDFRMQAVATRPDKIFIVGSLKCPAFGPNLTYAGSRDVRFRGKRT
jgi:hypothetical protein